MQKYGKACVKVPDNSLVKDVQFHVPFEDEENMADGDGVKDTPCDVDIFYNTMSKLMLALVGEPRSVGVVGSGVVGTVSPSTADASVVQPLMLSSQLRGLSSLPPSAPPPGETATHDRVVAQTQSINVAQSVKSSSGLSPVSEKRASVERSATPESVKDIATMVSNSPPVRDNDATAPPRKPSLSAALTKTVLPAESGDVTSSGVTEARSWIVRPETVVLSAPHTGSNQTQNLLLHFIHFFARKRVTGSSITVQFCYCALPCSVSPESPSLRIVTSVVLEYTSCYCCLTRVHRTLLLKCILCYSCDARVHRRPQMTY